MINIPYCNENLRNENISPLINYRKLFYTKASCFRDTYNDWVTFKVNLGISIYLIHFVT